MGIHHLQMSKVPCIDVKPSNIFLVDVGEEKVAKVGDYNLFKQAVEKNVTGSACYLPPEVFRGESQPGTVAADSWAAGCILYELCTRKRAFEARTIGALSMKVVDETLEQIPSDYSIYLQKLVDSLLDKIPRSRPLIADILNDNPLIKEMVEKLKKGPTEEERRKEYNEQFGLTQVSSADPYGLVGVSSVSS